ncbi:MAG: hypothetical protein Q9211_002075 [Gyalolechia sp. 1 TL-2023]
MRKVEQDFDDGEEDPGNAGQAEAPSEETQEQLRDAEERQGFLQYSTERSTLDSEWKQMNKNRSLQARALQNAGFVEHDIECYKSTQETNPHGAFVQASRNRHWARDTSEEDKLIYKPSEKNLMQDTLAKAGLVGTTLSNAADSNLKNGRTPRVILVDECCQETELEALLAWAHNSESVELTIFIGDPKQLPPTVLTYNLNWQGAVVNPFAPQLRLTYFERLHRRGFYVYRLNTNFRLCEPLTEPWNRLWYDGTLATDASAQLARRPDAQAGSAFIKKTFGVPSPAILLDVSGVCLNADPRRSRLNLHNIVVVIHYVKLILACKLWKEEDIAIITPHWEQTRRYHELLRSLKLYGITACNIDSFQGRQSPFVILDITTALLREAKGIEFMVEGERLNVGLSRPEEMMMLVSDTGTTAEPTVDENDEDQVTRARINRERQKYIRAVHGYYKSHNLVRKINSDVFQEWELVHKSLITEFQAKRVMECHNCRQPGHFVKDCKGPKVECKWYGDPGYLSAKCDNRVDTRTCHECHKPGHIKSECQDVTCRVCNKICHAFCAAETVCRFCGQLGHFKKDWTIPQLPKKKRMPFILPGRATPVDVKDFEDIEVATSAEARVEQPEMRQDWAELKVDPKANLMTDEEDNGTQVS